MVGTPKDMAIVEDLLRIIEKLLNAEDLDFLLTLKNEDLERLIVAIRGRLEAGGF